MELLGEIQQQAAVSLENPFPSLVAKKYLIASFVFSLGSVGTGQERSGIFLFLCRGLSLPTCPACLTTQVCVPAWHILQNHEAFCGSSLLCGDCHTPARAERCQASLGSCREKAQSKACSGTACPGDMSVGSCGDWGIRWQISAVMFFFFSREELLASHCAWSHRALADISVFFFSAI